MSQQIDNPKNLNQEVPLNLKIIRKLQKLIVANWYSFLIAIAFALSGAYFYNKYTIPTYRISSSILIEEGGQASLPGINNQMLEGFGLRPGSQNMDNQVMILKSRSLIRNTLYELPFDIDVYRKGLIKKVSYYPLFPIKLIPGVDGAPQGLEFTFAYFTGNLYNLSCKGDSDIELDTILSFGQEVKFSEGSFTMLPHPDLEDWYKTGEKIYFTFYERKFLVKKFRDELTISNSTQDGTILTISLESTNRAKAIYFLDKLIEVFMRSNLEKKNQEANRIIAFIDNQLINVTDSLTITEKQLQEFRSRNQIMDISVQAQQIIDQAVILENEKAELTLKSNYYDYLEEYLSKDNIQEVPIAPSSMEIEDPLLNQLMQEFVGLQAEYFSSVGGEKNPMQSQLKNRMLNTKQSLREIVRSIKRANSMALIENSNQIRDLNAKTTSLPEKEQQLLGFERKFNLNNVLYTFLLQKRAEAQIQKASNKPDNELIDVAEADLEPIAPPKNLVYWFAILLGGGLPFLIIMIRYSVHNKITSEEDLEMISDLPIAGYIPHSRLSYNAVVLTEPQSRLAESFRSLRTRMEFFTREVKSPVILITSSMPREGKTFTAINLASAYSLAGMKTLIVGFDLRRPTLSSSFNLNGEAGLSSFLIGKSNLDQVIVETSFPNLHVIPTGPIPPNPGELATSKKSEEMFRVLQGMYDFIIVDSAPIGVVSDSYAVAAIADATLLLVRHSKTNKQFLKATLTEVQTYGIDGLSFLINDVRSNRSSYGYFSKYKYDY